MNAQRSAVFYRRSVSVLQTGPPDVVPAAREPRQVYRINQRQEYTIPAINYKQYGLFCHFLIKQQLTCFWRRAAAPCDRLLKGWELRDAD
jgi:hypothetical protein